MTTFWAYDSDALNIIVMVVFQAILLGTILFCWISDLRHPPTRRCGKTGRCRMPARK